MANLIEASGLACTIVRLAWLMDADEVDYELTSRNGPLKGTVASRRSVGPLISEIIARPGAHVGVVVVESGCGMRHPNIQRIRHLPGFWNERYQQRSLGDTAGVGSCR